MKTLYIECTMGAAGDMLMAALLELLPDRAAFVQKLNALGIPGVHVALQRAVRCGITGTSVAVHVHGQEEHSEDVQAAHDHDGGHGHRHDHGHVHDHGDAGEHDHAEGHGSGHHHHTGVADITALIGSLPVSPAVQRHALAVYALIAEAEAHAHGAPIQHIHFHEVGTMDAVTDIIGVCMLLDALNPDRVVVSPVHVGSGQVRCSHGILPVPAPATAHILRGVPTYGGNIRGELCTPTGAALLKHFATDFGAMPVMAVDAIGYGMGKKEFPAANCVRVMIGAPLSADGPNGEVNELSCNLDDMTGEALGYAQQALLDAGALDVFIAPIQMKKSRPAHCLHCLCKPQDADRLAQTMLHHTSTFGVRRAVLPRYMLERSFHTVRTPYGDVRVKTGEGYGVHKAKPEYEDVKAAALTYRVSLDTVYQAVEQELCKNEQRA